MRTKCELNLLLCQTEIGYMCNVNNAAYTSRKHVSNFGHKGFSKKMIRLANTKSNKACYFKNLEKNIAVKKEVQFES